jgi:hypothetical protein
MLPRWDNGAKKMHLVQKLVVKAIALAIARDGASGGVVRTINVSYFSFYVDVYVCKYCLIVINVHLQRIER